MCHSHTRNNKRVNIAPTYALSNPSRQHQPIFPSAITPPTFVQQYFETSNSVAKQTPTLPLYACYKTDQTTTLRPKSFTPRSSRPSPTIPLPFTHPPHRPTTVPKLQLPRACARQFSTLIYPPHAHFPSPLYPPDPPIPILRIDSISDSSAHSMLAHPLSISTRSSTSILPSTTQLTQPPIHLSSPAPTL